MGSYDIFGLDDSSCFDRHARLGPYGLPNDASTYTGAKEEDSFAWADIDFAKLQRESSIQHGANGQGQPSDLRTAVVLRAWDGLRWTADDTYNIRAMFAELVLHSGGAYQVFILLHIRDPAQALLLTGETIQDVKARYVPSSLVGITELWNYTDCETAYPLVGEYE